MAVENKWLMGHSSIVVTMDRYGHLFPDDMDNLADALERARSEALAAPPRHGELSGVVGVRERR